MPEVTGTAAEQMHAEEVERRHDEWWADDPDTSGE